MTQAKLVDITMPSLGADMTEGMLVKWLVKEGDRVNNGDIIAELETHKGAIDMEVYQSGTIAELLVQPIVTVPVGTVLARLQPEAADEETIIPSLTIAPELSGADSFPPADVSVQAAPAIAESPLPEQQIGPLPQSPQAPSTEGQFKEPALAQRGDEPFTKGVVTASPIVRRMAIEQLLDLSEINGSGPHGAILLKDLPLEAQQKPTQADAMHSAIAVAMERSKTEIPHFYLNRDIDITEAQNWLQKKNAEKSPEHRLLLIALLLKAIANALVKFPTLNGFYSEKGLLSAEGIHIGNVISLRQGGMVVPAIHDVDKLSLQDTMWALRDITGRSRSGHLRSSELSDATITVTNMGDRGADRVFGIIYPPQVAIIGLGRPRQTAMVKDSTITIGDILTVCLSADHRVVDGMLGAKFLNALSSQLQKPECL